MARMAYEVVKYVGVYESIEEKSICFEQEEDAICFVSKFLGGNGYIRLKEVGYNKKVYKSLEEYEDEFERGLY